MQNSPLHPHPPTSVLRGLFGLQDFKDCPRRPARGVRGRCRSRGRRASSGPSRALLCAGPAADGGPPSLPSCSSFSITLSFSSADPPRPGPRKRTAIPWGRKHSLPSVRRSSSWQRVEKMEKGLRNNQEVAKSRRRETQSERRAAAARERREGERAGEEGRVRGTGG